MTKRIIIPTINENLIIKFLNFFLSVLFKISFTSTDNPNEDNIIKDKDAKTSNLTNAELTYIPINPKINENKIISFLIKPEFFIWYFFTINQIPNPAKIIRIEW